MDRAADSRIPADSLIFGYGPMLPFVAAAIGLWALPPHWAALALQLGIVWGALILAFLAGVRRGFGFGSNAASTFAEIATMLVYFVIAGLALIVPDATARLILLFIGFAAVVLLDTRAARHGDAPAHFARLRPPQIAIALVALVAMMLRV
ncbi:hypothetical protein GCM10011380_07310 [Sphingomonas metalli]|uniref:DUF3429 domain-containing protein n=1 Tax=Sphingomonas metalli TaxID=1779358 RepID=A0A916SVZ6_9SPHN|nr:DUF3429 domain-containing protein [Sphingomonas metalli]GGB20266.1 hypothetical protein GCM10011380_07310 [Sphingomonas metalli]